MSTYLKLTYYILQYMFLSWSWSTQACDDPDELTWVLSLRNSPVVTVLGFRPASVSHDLMVIAFHVWISWVSARLLIYLQSCSSEESRELWKNNLRAILFGEPFKYFFAGVSSSPLSSSTLAWVQRAVVSNETHIWESSRWCPNFTADYSCSRPAPLSPCPFGATDGEQEIARDKMMRKISEVTEKVLLCPKSSELPT